MNIVLSALIALTGLVATSLSHADGQSDYEQNCTACHGFGIAGAPKLGDTENWAPRIARGKEELYSNAINGFTGDFGYMPAKGGFTNLSEARIREIVDFMVAQSE